MSELENIKPVAFYRADWKGDMMFRKDNTVVVRKNEGDFTTGWIKPLYDELPEPQPQLTLPKRIVEILGKYDEYNPTADKLIMMAYRDYQEFHDWIIKDWVKNDNISRAYLAGKALGVDLVKVGEG